LCPKSQHLVDEAPRYTRQQSSRLHGIPRYHVQNLQSRMVSFVIDPSGPATSRTSSRTRSATSGCRAKQYTAKVSRELVCVPRQRSSPVPGRSICQGKTWRGRTVSREARRTLMSWSSTSFASPPVSENSRQRVGSPQRAAHLPKLPRACPGGVGPPKRTLAIPRSRDACPGRDKPGIS
jgi:hypothetical protein